MGDLESVRILGLERLIFFTLRISRDFEIDKEIRKILVIFSIFIVILSSRISADLMNHEQ